MPHARAIKQWLLDSLATCCLALLLATPVQAQTRCAPLGVLHLENLCEHIGDVVQQGRDELIVSGWAYHDRHTYSPEKIKSFQEFAYGGGWGRYLERDPQHLESVSLTVFADSHERPQTTLSYDWLRTWGQPGELQWGVGGALLLVSRSDVLDYIPIPGVLPLAMLRKDRVQLMMTFIPRLGGSLNNGNLFYLQGRYLF